jgi:hypothetical protein
VQIHTDSQDQVDAHDLQARAFTVGKDIAFAGHQYAPETDAGRELLAHELAHVAQAGETATAPAPYSGRLSQTHDLVEREARAVAGAVLAGQPLPALQQQTAPGVVYRDEGVEKKTAKAETAEDRKRAAILADLTRETEFPEALSGRIASAMRAFTLGQLKQMQKAGVRFWGRTGLPPAFEKAAITMEELSTPGEYTPLARVIRLSLQAKTSHIRHELAHAWDHVRAMARPAPLKEPKAMQAALKSPGAFWSESTTKRATREIKKDKSVAAKLTVNEMFDRYKGRIWRRELAFDGPGTREGHSLRSSKEFYAEGYSVFHGPDISSQMKLRYYAPELYELLKSESLANKQPVPDEKELDQAEKDFGYSK